MLTRKLQVAPEDIPAVKYLLDVCLEDENLVKAFNALAGASIGATKDELLAAIDDNTGKRSDDLQKFLDLALNVWVRLPEEAKAECRKNAKYGR